MSEEQMILDRLDRIEKRLAALESRRPQYVPPPTYGPLPETPPKLEWPQAVELSDELLDAFNKFIERRNTRAKTEGEK